jgi:hypothetical protein
MVCPFELPILDIRCWPLVEPKPLQEGQDACPLCVSPLIRFGQVGRPQNFTCYGAICGAPGEIHFILFVGLELWRWLLASSREWTSMGP